MFSRVRVTKTSLEIRGRRLKPQNMRLTMRLPENPQHYLPFILAFVVFMVSLMMSNPALIKSLGSIILGLLVIFGIISLVSAFSPLFLADQSKEMLTWFDFSGQPKTQLFFRDIEHIELGTRRESIALIIGSGESLAGKDELLWYLNLVDKDMAEREILVTSSENEARKTAEYLTQLMHRPIVDKSSDTTLDATSAGLPLWQKMVNGGDLPEFPEIKEEDGILVNRVENGVVVRIKPFDDFPLKESKKLLGYIILGIVTGISLFLSFILAMGEVISPVVVLILFALMVFITIYTNNYYRIVKNHEEAFVIDRSAFKIMIRKDKKFDETACSLEDLRDIRIDEVNDIHLTVVTKDQIYYLAYSLSLGRLRRLEQALKAALVVMKIKPDEEKREMGI